MKNVIYTYYNILLDEINKDNSNYYFYFKGDMFLFYLVENDINLIKKIYDYIINNNIECYEIIKNKDNELFTRIDKKNYALLKIKGILKYEIKFDEFKHYPLKENGNDWGKLWSNRLDYYEIQIRELGFNYQTVLNSYGIFSGLASNAILYYNLSIKTFKDIPTISIVHNRMQYPMYQLDYNNPLNFVIDYSIRDIAEYIKAYVMSDEYEETNIILLLDRLELNKLMFNLLYSRLLYPTFYFDVFDKIILEDGVDSDVVIVSNNLDKYLNMIKMIYNRYKEKYNMFNINWINKNVES